MSRRAETLLGVTEDERASTAPSPSCWCRPTPRRAAAARFAAAVAEAAAGAEEPVSAFVRPWNTFGVRMRARIAPCGPPRAALVVLEDQPARRASSRGSALIALQLAILRRRRQRPRAPRSATSAAGSRTEPSSRWPFSSSAMIVRPTATAVPFSVWTCAGRPSRGPVADVEPPGLVVGRVRARGQLAVAALARQPGLAVVLLGRRRAQVVDRDRHHPVGDLELLEDRLLDRQQPLVLGLALLGLDEAEHLDLVELVHAEDPARVLAGGARLAPEAGREPGVAERAARRRARISSRAARPAPPPRCRPGTGRRRPGGRSAARCRAGSRCRTGRCSRTSTGGITGSKPSRAELLERVADERELEHHEIAAQVGEARARQPGAPRSMSIRGPASSRWSRPVAPASPTSRRTVSSSGASRRRQVGQRGELRVAARRAPRSPRRSARGRARPARRAARAPRASAGPCGPGWPGSARPAAPRAAVRIARQRSSSSSTRSTPAAASGAAPGERRPHGVRVAADQLDVEHGAAPRAVGPRPRLEPSSACRRRRGRRRCSGHVPGEGPCSSWPSWRRQRGGDRADRRLLARHDARDLGRLAPGVGGDELAPRRARPGRPRCSAA